MSGGLFWNEDILNILRTLIQPNPQFLNLSEEGFAFL